MLSYRLDFSAPKSFSSKLTLSPKKMVPPKPRTRTDRFSLSHPSEQGWVYVPAEVSFYDLQCCGAKELHGLQTSHTLVRQVCEDREVETFYVLPEEIVARLKIYWAERWHKRERPFIIFTDNHADYTRGEPFQGQRLTEFILEHSLGTVVRTGKHFNENSGNEVECFTWVVNWPKVHAFKPKEQENEQERSS